MKNWQKLIDRATKIVKEGNDTLYRRVQLLAQVFDDREFTEDVLADGGDPQGYLDKLVSDTCANFYELYQMLKKFPNKEQWVDGDIGEMRSQVISDIRSVQKRNGNGTHRPSEMDAPGKTESREEKRRKSEEEQMSWKERCLKAEEQLRIVKAQLKVVRDENRDMKEIIKGLSHKRRQPAGV